MTDLSKLSDEDLLDEVYLVPVDELDRVRLREADAEIRRRLAARDADTKAYESLRCELARLFGEQKPRDGVSFNEQILRAIGDKLTDDDARITELERDYEDLRDTKMLEACDECLDRAESAEKERDEARDALRVALGSLDPQANAVAYHVVSRTLGVRSERTACPYGDETCPCRDGDMCHYEGPDAWPAPVAAEQTTDSAHSDVVNDRTRPAGEVFAEIEAEETT